MPSGLCQKVAVLALARRLSTAVPTLASLIRRLIAQLADRDNITEQLKATDQMEWVRRMNAARAAATEIVNSELIYR